MTMSTRVIEVSPHRGEIPLQLDVNKGCSAIMDWSVLNGSHGDDVVVLQVKNPSEMLVRKVDTTGAEYATFNHLMAELASILDHSGGYAHFVPIDIKPGKNYMVRVPTKKQPWCRARIEDIMEGATTYRVICYLLDYGQEVTVDKYSLRQVDTKYFDLPALAKSVSLARVRPAALVTDQYTMDVSLGPSNKWSPSSIEYLKRSVLGAADVRVEYLSGSSHKVIMYQGDMNINEVLVTEGMAIYQDEIVVPEPKKIYSFEEFQAMERALEEKPSVSTINGDLGQSGDWSPHAGGTVLKSRKSSTAISNGIEPQVGKGRARALLQSLDNKPKVNGVAAVAVNGRSDTELTCYASTDTTSKQKYTRSRRPNLNKVKPSVSSLSSGQSEASSATVTPTSHKQLTNLSCSAAGDRAPSVTEDVEENIGAIIVPDHHMPVGGCLSTTSQPFTEAPRLYDNSVNNHVEESSHQSEFQLSSITYDQSRAMALKKQAAVFSDVPITPVFTIRNAKLHERAVRHWRSMGGSEQRPPRTLQAYLWPALRRGLEVVAVSDAFSVEGQDGVSLSYLVAVATTMFDVDAYKGLPSGGSPRCLVLCSSWSKAESIYFHVSCLFGDKPEKSLLLLHGRRDTEHRLCCQLINGTDVIVSTPCTFIRMLDEGHVNMERLCHLMVDDADVITKEFPAELSAIMKEIGTAVRNNPERAAPRQVALFSNTWTEQLGLFRKEYMTAPVTIITNHIEAAVACQVKQMVHFVEREDQRLGKMWELVKESGSPTIKLVVCAHTDSDASKIYHALKTYGIEVYVAATSLGGIDSTIKMWEEVRSENSYPILVVTDEVLEMLISDDNAVVDASYVLHYNMPATKKLLGLRLHCLSGHYKENADDLMLSSHIIFTPKDRLAATTLVKILEKTGSPVPAPLKKLSNQTIEAYEKGKNKELCHYMKTFGACRDVLKCSHRHLISAELDKPADGLPTSGDVEFKVVSVRDAATSYVRLIKHRDEAGVVRDVSNNKFTLDLSLQSHFSQEQLLIPIDPALARFNKLCVYGKDSVYHRARIVRAPPDPLTQHTVEVTILLLDEGVYCRAPINRLYELPETCSLEKIPVQIVEIKLCKLKPMDHDVDWSREAIAYMSQLLQGQTLSGKIQLCLGNTIWCEPVVKRQYLKVFSIWVNLWTASSKLVGNVNIGHLAVKNPTHLDLLRTACQGKITLPVISTPAKSLKRERLLSQDAKEDTVLAMQARQLDEGGYNDVYLAAIEDPDKVFLIRVDQHSRLQEMEEELDKEIRKKGKIPLTNPVFRQLCVAKYPDGDCSWCRCMVLSLVGSKINLLSVDYGRLLQAEIKDVSDLPAAPEDLRLLPYQAIECHLATVLPADGAWAEKAGDLIWDQCGNSLSLRAKVVTSKPSMYIGDTNYGIELVDRLDKGDLYLSDMLIDEGFAIERKLDVLERLNLSEELDQLDYTFQQIPRLLRLLNRTDCHDKRFLIVEYIRQLVQQNVNLKVEMKHQGIIKSLCSLVNTVNLHEELLSLVIDSFNILVMNDVNNAEEMWWEKGFTFLHEKLEICDDNGLLTRLLTCLRHLLKSRNIRNEVDNLETFTNNLIHIVRTSTLPQNKLLAVHILNLYVDKETRRVDRLFKEDVVAVLYNALLVYNDELCEACAQLINTLVTLKSKQPSPDPWSDTLTRLAAVMFKVKSDQGLQACANTLYSMLKNLNGAKEILNFTHLHEKLQRLINSGLNTQTKEACINVMVKVKPDPPSAKLVEPVRVKPKKTVRSKPKAQLLIQPISKDDLDPSDEIKVPKVCWWECGKFLMIQVQIHDALSLNPPPTLTYKSHRLHFSCGMYQFKLGPLYSNIVSRRSGREVCSSEIKYALYKEKPGLWYNLLKSGHKKPSFVHPNMDRMIMSSDEESVIDYSKSPFQLKPATLLKYSGFESMRTDSNPSAVGGPPEDFESSDETEDEEDERFDERHNSHYELFDV